MRLPYRWRWLLAFAAIAITCGCDALIPPLPDVPPIVEPVPSGKVAWVLVVEETAERTPEVAAVLLDPWWKSSGIKFRIYDKDMPEAADAVKAVGAIKLPAVVITDKAGNVLRKGELPRTIDAVRRFVGG